MKYLVALTALLCFTVAAAADTRFTNPRVNKMPLDWCLFPTKQCGKPAAERYCQLRNMGHAVKFKGQRSEAPTYIVGARKICDQSTYDHCDRFSWITCSATRID